MRFRISRLFSLTNSRNTPYAHPCWWGIGCRVWVQSLYHCNGCVGRTIVLYMAAIYPDTTVYSFGFVIDMFYPDRLSLYLRLSLILAAGSSRWINTNSWRTERCQILVWNIVDQIYFLKRHPRFCSIHGKCYGKCSEDTECTHLSMISHKYPPTDYGP